MNDMPTVSSCCGAVRYIEPIWLNVSREGGGIGRRQIGEVVACGNARTNQGECPRRAIGDPRPTTRTRILAKAWDLMMQRHSWPPYYFTDVNGELLPEAIAPFAQKSLISDPTPKPAQPAAPTPNALPAPAPAAAAMPEEPEPEPEYGPE